MIMQKTQWEAYKESTLTAALANFSKRLGQNRFFVGSYVRKAWCCMYVALFVYNCQDKETQQNSTVKVKLRKDEH